MNILFRYADAAFAGVNAALYAADGHSFSLGAAVFCGLAALIVPAP
jgi:hypothetical protein